MQLKKLSVYFLSNALAPTTRRNYRSASSTYEHFCHHIGCQPYPPMEENLILYVTKLATHSSHSNIKMHLAAIRYFSIKVTSFSPIHTFQRLYYLIKGIRRTQGSSRKRALRDPITPAILIRIRGALFASMRPYEDKVMFWAAILVAFYGFLRVSEYTSTHKTRYDADVTLLSSDISLSHNEVRVNIKASKTDPFREGVVLRIAKNGTVLCPVIALSEYLHYRPNGHGPLFVFSDGRFLSRYDVNKILKETTHEQVSISSHSLRIGAASTAAAMGCPKWLIQCMGRWNSDCFKNYIRVPAGMIEKTSRALARCTMPNVPIFCPRSSLPAHPHPYDI